MAKAKQKVVQTESEFEQCLLEKLKWAENLHGYDLKGARDLIAEFGAVNVAKMLVDPNHTRRPANGFLVLVRQGSENLTFEQAIIDFEESGLFTPADVKTAKKRLSIFAVPRK